jgi:hypothetical protein
MKMSKPRFGKLKPVYSVLLNPHGEYRLTKCPHCENLTYPRKFALLIAVLGWMPYAQGKTCKYCTRCKMIIVDQDELELEMGTTLAEHAPQVVGKEYLLIGVVEMKTFKRGLTDDRETLVEMRERVSDFKKQYGMGIRPGGWYKEGYEPPPLPGYRDQRVPVIVDGKRVD